MMATPMLARLKRTFPQTRFDWAVFREAYDALLGNKKVNRPRLIPTFPGTQTIDQLELIDMLQSSAYDTVIIPDHYPEMAQVARRAEVEQRIGLWHSGAGYSLTLPVQAPNMLRHQTRFNVALAELGNSSIQISRPPMEFFPADTDCKAVMDKLHEELNWWGERPLLLLNPGSGDEDDGRRWPIERYVLLGNRIMRHHDVQIVVVGVPSDAKLSQEVTGMIAGRVPNWTSQLTLGQLGALSELAALYIGNDCGATHIAAAMGCPTLAIFGPTDPSVSAPYGREAEQVRVLRTEPEGKRPFSWEDGVTVGQVETVVKQMLS